MPSAPTDPSPTADAGVGVYVDGPDGGSNACAVDLHFVYGSPTPVHEIGLLYELGHKDDGAIYTSFTYGPATFPSENVAEFIYGQIDDIDMGMEEEPCGNLFAEVTVFCISGDCPDYAPWQHPQGYEYEISLTVKESSDEFNPVCLSMPWKPECQTQ